MANATKEVLRGFATYAKIVNAHLKEFHERLEIIEIMIQSRPELAETYRQASKAKGRVFSPGPNTQLQAIEQAIQRLPD